jgi:hypothetical protein
MSARAAIGRVFIMGCSNVLWQLYGLGYSSMPEAMADVCSLLNTLARLLPTVRS